MSVVTASTRIAATPAEVWELVMDPHRLAEWVTIHSRLLHADPGPPRRGFQMDQRIHMRGVSLVVHWKLLECREERLAVWDGRGPARSRARSEYILHEEGGGTRFDYRNEFRPPLGGVGALVSRALVGGMPEREARRTLDRLRAKLEEGTSARDGNGN
jgi:carbon monoxide dehydrogenase subunit G